MKKRRRPYKTKKRVVKRNKKYFFQNKFFWIFVTFFIFSGGLFYLLFMSPYFQVKETSIAGGKTISKESLLKNFESDAKISLNIFGNNLMSQSLFIPSQGKISSLLENFPEIEDVKIKKDFFTKKIVIEVKEKKPICIWCLKNNCVLLDKNATYIKNYENETGLIKINEIYEYEKNLKNWSGETKQDFLITLLTVNKNNNEIAEFDIYADKFFGKYKNINFIFDPKKDIDWQIKKMDIVLKKLGYKVETLSYIDLRFGEQVVIK